MRRLSASVVLTAASNLHYARLFGILAVFAAIFAVFLAWTITWGMGAFVLILIICHDHTPCSASRCRDV